MCRPTGIEWRRKIKIGDILLGLCWYSLSMAILSTWIRLFSLHVLFWFILLTAAILFYWATTKQKKKITELRVYFIQFLLENEDLLSPGVIFPKSPFNHDVIIPLLSLWLYCDSFNHSNGLVIWSTENMFLVLANAISAHRFSFVLFLVFLFVFYSFHRAHEH